MLFNTEEQIKIAAQQFIETMVMTQCCIFNDMTDDERRYRVPPSFDAVRMMALDLAADLLDEFKVDVLAKIKSIEFDPNFEVEQTSSLTFSNEPPSHPLF